MHLYSARHGDDLTVQQMSGALHSPRADSGRGRARPCSPLEQLAGYKRLGMVVHEGGWGCEWVLAVFLHTPRRQWLPCQLETPCPVWWSEFAWLLQAVRISQSQLDQRVLPVYRGGTS